MSWLFPRAVQFNRSSSAVRMAAGEPYFIFSLIPDFQGFPEICFQFPICLGTGENPLSVSDRAVLIHHMLDE